MNTVGIIAALPMEGRWLQPGRIHPDTNLQPDPHALLRVCGMGGKRAARAAHVLVESGADGLVSWGVAGGLDPALASGTVLLPKQVANDRDAPPLPTDTAWRSRLRDCLGDQVPIDTGSMLSVSEPVTRIRTKNLLHQQGHASVDMESRAIAEVADQTGVPFVIIRAVSDTADMALPPLASRSLDPFGRVRPGLFLGNLLRSRPREMIALKHLAQATGEAARNMKTVRERAGITLQHAL